jgi:hypothetical protein
VVISMSVYQSISISIDDSIIIIIIILVLVIILTIILISNSQDVKMHAYIPRRTTSFDREEYKGFLIYESVGEAGGLVVENCGASTSKCRNRANTVSDSSSG